MSSNTEHEEFDSYRDLDKENISQHLMKTHLETREEIKENKASRKGRKRTHKFQFTSISQLIEDHVIPKWREYMRSKTARREGDSRKEPRTDTMWKKMLRDVREFYRILFRMRFHHLEYKNSIGAEK